MELVKKHLGGGCYEYRIMGKTPYSTYAEMETDLKEFGLKITKKEQRFWDYVPSTEYFDVSNDRLRKANSFTQYFRVHKILPILIVTANEFSLASYIVEKNINGFQISLISEYEDKKAEQFKKSNQAWLYT